MSFIPRINKVYKDVTFTNDEIRRYGRHLIMPEVTLEGQQKLKAARVIVIGTGGLGAPILAYLAAAGVGHIGVVDFDTVDISNLHRQIIHKTGNVGKLKTQSAVELMKEINPLIDIKTYDTSLRSDNALELLKDYDIVIDGTDNFPTRYLVNDACALLDKPNVYGSIFRFEGQATVFWSSQGPCYRCLYPEPPEAGTVPSCAEGGVLGVLPGVMGTIQATEAVKLIIGQGDPLIGRLLLFDALKMKFKELKLRKDPKCPLCGPNKTITELIDYEFFCGTAPEQKKAVHIDEIDVEDVEAAIKSGKIPAEIDLLDIREPFEAKIAQIPHSRLISLAEFSKRMHELDSAREIWLYCKDGARSGKAWKLLYDAGFRKIKNVAGGIDAWSEDIDPETPGIEACRPETGLMGLIELTEDVSMTKPGTETAPDIDVENKLKEAFARGWSVIVWNDPINLMDYVVYVFKSVLKMNEADATRHMWEVHQKGKSSVARDTKEKSELIVHRLRGFGLNATMEQAT